MERVLTILGSKSDTGYFGRMVVFSLLMHAIFSTAVLLGHPGRNGSAPVEYIDLKMVEPIASPSPVAETEQVSPPQEIQTTAPAPLPAAEAPVEKPAAAEQAEAKPEALTPASFGFGIVNGRFGGISDGRTLRDDMREYYLGMLDRFNESWWKARSDAAGIRGAAFIVTISRNGEIIDTQLLESSGNRSYDRLMLQSLKTAGPLSPLPESYEADFFTAPLRFVGPLNLMNPFSG